MDKDEAIVLLSGEFGKQLLRGVMNYTTPVSWGIIETGIWKIHGNGTAFLLNCGQDSFLVTAAHVYEGYLDAQKKYPQLRSYVGDIEFCFTDRLICHLGSSILDIVTFRITTDEIARLKKQVAYGSSDWLRPVVEHDGVLFGGYPGKERNQRLPEEVNFGMYVGLTPASSSSERHFGCVLEHDEWIDAIGNGIPQEGYDLGGVSGGPAFRVHENEIGIITWTIAGVIYNASSVLADIVLCNHIHFVKPDGTLSAPA
ncbi:S1 family peptidase [Janthinobacterium sp. 13]|uniref:S1 family peptidase n=1 Tax=Janthinobacterium sp. 13 TaxID=2035211 RepID=UPI000C4E26A0|nr:S1 family peptidase [Janthinobacterium sp. 13]PIF13352.1 hypothetical protein CLU94_5461 [Janthinobacterium sp. 13]